ncbi:MAG: hypothetical protein HQK89_03495 [Nitrospirae bacterium]|nr:hypothetical protein [Nitrospirota bacterium]
MNRSLFIPFFSALSYFAFAVTVNAYGAEEGGGHSSGFSQWFWLVVNFSVLIAIIVVFLRKPLAEFFARRTELIEKTLLEAKDAKMLAEKALKDIEEKLRLKDEEIQKIIASAREMGEHDRDRLIENGRMLSDKVKELTESNIAYELKKTRDEIKSAVIEMALELAKDKMREQITKEQKDNLINDAIDSIGSKN